MPKTINTIRNYPFVENWLFIVVNCIHSSIQLDSSLHLLVVCVRIESVRLNRIVRIEMEMKREYG